MANDGEININTKVDTGGLDKGLRSVKNKVDKTSKEISKGTKTTAALKTAFNETGGAAASFAQKMSGLAASGGAVGAGIAAAIIVAKKFFETLKNGNEAYKVQEKAEKALSRAAENNPYLNGESVRRLEEYAGQLQKISDFGDEGTIDVMAQLAGTGRTEAEIMKIMGAAADYAAAKHIDLKTAAETLNATYSGTAGIMGRQITDVKELTDEQLKNGEAIDLIAQKYKGFAQETADSGTQVKNAYGDFLESVGRIANVAFEALNRKAKAFWEEMTAGMQKFGDSLENASRTWGIGGIKRAVDEAVDSMANTYTDSDGNEKRAVEFQNDGYLKWLEKELHLRKKKRDIDISILHEVQQELKYRERMAKYEAKEAEKAEKKRREAQAAAQAQKAARDYAEENNKKLQDNLNALEVQARAKGESVKAQDKYNVYLQSYIDLLTKTEGAIKEGCPVEEKRLEQLKEAKKALDEAADAEERLAAAIGLTQEVTNAVNSIKQELTPADELQKQIDSLEELKEKIREASDEDIASAQKDEENPMSREQLIDGLAAAEKSLIEEKIKAVSKSEDSWWEKHTSRQKEILDLKQAVIDSEVLSEEEKYSQLEKLDEQYKQSKTEQYAELIAEIQDYANQACDIARQAADLMMSTSKNKAAAEQAELETKYRKGEISEEEYNKKIAESKKKAAKEQYKIQMWQWGASILQATANIAQGVSMAIAQGGVAGLITGALVGAAGAVQIASIIASKPTPPSFSTGGIIGGSSAHGDNIAANLNSREMVMNMSQQKLLWDFINGGSGRAGGGTNIIINNSAANLVSAKPQITKDRIELMIDARVNDSLKNGRYNNSLNMAQQGMTGDYYGI